MKTVAALCLAGILGAQAFVAPAPKAYSRTRGRVGMENFNLPLGEVSVCVRVFVCTCGSVAGVASRRRRSKARHGRHAVLRFNPSNCAADFFQLIHDLTLLS